MNAPDDFLCRSFVYRKLLKHDANFEGLHDAAVAIDFGDPAGEAETARRLGLCDLSPLSRLGVKGAGTADWLAGQGKTLGSPLLMGLVLCFIVAVVTGVASTIGTIGILVPLSAPFVLAGELEAALPLFERAFAKWPLWRELVPRLPASGLLPDDPNLMEQILAK